LTFKKVSFLKFKFEIWREKIATEKTSEEKFDLRWEANFGGRARSDERLPLRY
jgi:hypothetical protein